MVVQALGLRRDAHAIEVETFSVPPFRVSVVMLASPLGSPNCACRKITGYIMKIHHPVPSLVHIFAASWQPEIFVGHPTTVKTTVPSLNPRSGDAD